MADTTPWSCILWDVDGTIVDASEGILWRLDTLMKELGRPEISRGELRHWIGPPLYDSFQAQLGLTGAEAAQAVVRYREIGRAHGYTSGAKLFPGIGSLITDLHRAGVPQGIASSKPEIQVIALMEHFGLTPFFTAMVGSTPDEQTLAAKSDIVAECLRRLRAAHVDVSRPVLIGDRHHDVDGGAANDVPVVFVTWGFSWPHESEGAQAVATDPATLRSLLLPATKPVEAAAQA